MSVLHYNDYKDSGVEWLGKVPSGWGIRRIRHLFEIRKHICGAEGHEVLSITQQGIKPKDIESGDGQLSADYSKYQFVEVGDFAMNHMDLLTGYVDISPVFGVTSPDYRVFSVRNKEVCFDRYYLYLFQAGYKNKIFYAFGQGSSQLGRWRFPTDEFNSFEFPNPPLEEQRQIAAFLDQETAKIDALIVEQQRLIGLLTEKRQAIISHAVTKGLNAAAPMKDSGVEWLGEVPDHWEIKRIKHSSSMISKGTTPTTVGAEFTSEGVRFLKAENISGSEVSRNPEFFISSDAHAILSRSELKEGDVLVVIAGATTGKSAVLQKDLLPANTNQAVSFIRPKDTRVSSYISFWLSTEIVRKVILLNSVQSAQPNLSMEDLGNIALPIPPITELTNITTFVSRETAKIDSLTAEALNAVSLLEERRTALIFAAVTGKIEVRGSVEVCPEEVAAE
jgi:type I restriction enzyme S subunit